MSTTEYDVSLVIHTSALTLEELAARLGAPPEDGSHDRGAPMLSTKPGVWTDTVWQHLSGSPRDASLEEQFRALEATLPASFLPPGVLPADARVYVSVGVFTDAQIPTIELTNTCWRVAERFGATIELRLYFPDMSEGE